MLLSYYKGGLITENNVFVFSSAVLVTQCYVRTNLQLLNPCTHERHQVPATVCLVHRDSRVALERGQNVEESINWSGVSPVQSARCPPQCAICCKTPSQSIKVIPVLPLTLDSFQPFLLKVPFRFRPLNKGPMNPPLAFTFRGSRDPINEASPEAVRT